MQVADPTPIPRPFERLLAVTGAVICLIITTMLWWSISSYQPMWPLPGLYFVEMAILGIIGASMFMRGGRGGRFVTWGATGALLGFVILGALSVGFFYLPVVLIFTSISVTYDVRNKQPFPAHLAVAVIAGMAQVALMMALS
jgi:hypothetical protein